MNLHCIQVYITFNIFFTLVMEDFMSVEELEWNLTSFFPELKDIIEKPPRDNPFKSQLKLRWYDHIKMILLSLLIPFRLILLTISLLLAKITSHLFMLNVKETTPPTPYKVNISNIKTVN